MPARSAERPTMSVRRLPHRGHGQAARPILLTAGKPPARRERDAAARDCGAPERQPGSSLDLESRSTSLDPETPIDAAISYKILLAIATAIYGARDVVDPADSNAA